VSSKHIRNVKIPPPLAGQPQLQRDSITVNLNKLKDEHLRVVVKNRALSIDNNDKPRQTESQEPILTVSRYILLNVRYLKEHSNNLLRALTALTPSKRTLHNRPSSIASVLVNLHLA
jgi:hypothetical protein